MLSFFNMHIAQSEITYMDSSWSSTLFEHVEVQVSANLSPQIAVLVLMSSMNTRTGSQQCPLGLKGTHTRCPRTASSARIPQDWESSWQGRNADSTICRQHTSNNPTSFSSRLRIRIPSLQGNEHQPPIWKGVSGSAPIWNIIIIHPC